MKNYNVGRKQPLGRRVDTLGSCRLMRWDPADWLDISFLSKTYGKRRKRGKEEGRWRGERKKRTREIRK